jgi:cytoskeletal protein RodZ
MDKHPHDEHSPNPAIQEDGSPKMVETDNPPTMNLFIMLFVLSVIVAISMVGLWQLTNFTIQAERTSNEPDPRLQNLRSQNIADRDQPEEVCILKCDTSSPVKHISIGRTASLMTQNWAQIQNSGPAAMQRSLLAPFGPLAAPPQAAALKPPVRNLGSAPLKLPPPSPTPGSKQP